jgi:hypothetical protein
MPRGQYDRKKAKAKRENHKDPVTLKLNELELAKLEQFSSKIRACESERMVVLSQKNAYIQQIDPGQNLAKFDAKMAALRQEREDADSGYQIVSKTVGDRLGIKLSEYAYDDVSGQLNHLAPEKK